MYVALMALRVFMSKNWDFKNDKFLSLNDHLLEKDRKDFYFDRKNINLEQYYCNGISAGTKYVLNQSDDETANARRRAKMYYLTIIFCLLYCAGYFLGLRYFTIPPKPCSMDCCSLRFTQDS